MAGRPLPLDTQDPCPIRVQEPDSYPFKNASDPLASPARPCVGAGWTAVWGHIPHASHHPVGASTTSHTHTPLHTHACTPTSTHACAVCEGLSSCAVVSGVRVGTYTHARTHARTRTHMRMRACTHTHTLTRANRSYRHSPGDVRAHSHTQPHCLHLSDGFCFESGGSCRCVHIEFGGLNGTCNDIEVVAGTTLYIPILRLL